MLSGFRILLSATPAMSIELACDLLAIVFIFCLVDFLDSSGSAAPSFELCSDCNLTKVNDDSRLSYYYWLTMSPSYTSTLLLLFFNIYFFIFTVFAIWLLSFDSLSSFLMLSTMRLKLNCLLLNGPPLF